MPNKLVNYPWRCLCLGVEQIMYTRPLRLTTLHFAHIFLTDARTFMFNDQGSMINDQYRYLSLLIPFLIYLLFTVLCSLFI